MHLPSPFILLFIAAVSGGLAAPLAARELSAAETAAWSMARPLEKDGFAFRAESWSKDIGSELGKAVKVQLFKGNDYRFCIAVPVKSGVKITAAVLDFEGKPAGEIQEIEEGWGLVLMFKPKKTGVYAVAIRQADGKHKTVECAMLTGYK